MRVSREAMARHHDEIVAAASKMLRRRGIDGVSVVDLMQAVGLTHGGFYRHFESKDALVAEATTTTFKSMIEMLEARTARMGAKAALAEYVADYLSNRHVESPEIGCPIAAFGADAAREDGPVRGVFASGVSQLLTWIAGGLSGPQAQRRARAAKLLSLMVGAIVTARATGDARLSRGILSSTFQQAERLLGES